MQLKGDVTCDPLLRPKTMKNVLVQHLFLEANMPMATKLLFSHLSHEEDTHR